MTDSYSPPAPGKDAEDSPVEPSADDRDIAPIVLAVALAGAVSILGLWLVLLVCFMNDWAAPTTWGSAGDSVAPITAAFTALTLAAAVYATVLQRADLRKQAESVEMQREELKLQRQEMRDATAVQVKIAERQEALAKAQKEAADAMLRVARAQEKATDKEIIIRVMSDVKDDHNAAIQAMSRACEIVDSYLSQDASMPEHPRFPVSDVQFHKARLTAMRDQERAWYSDVSQMMKEWIQGLLTETDEQRSTRLSKMSQLPGTAARWRHDAEELLSSVAAIEEERA